MPRNSGGGKKWKRNKKFSNGNRRSRELLLKQAGQDYAYLEQACGDSRFKCITTDGEKREANVPGSFKKRCWFRVQDIVLVSVREFQPNKVDICYKYNPDEARLLEQKGYLPMMRTLGDNPFSTTMDEESAEIPLETNSDDCEEVEVEAI